MKKIKIPYPLRYRNLEDAKTAITDISFAKELSVPSHVVRNGRTVVNEEYIDAPYEIGLFELRKKSK